MATDYKKLYVPPFPNTLTGWQPKKQPYEDMLNYKADKGGTASGTPHKPIMSEVEPDDDNLAEYERLVGELAMNTITPEEEEKRVKAATAAQGWGAMGNGLSAISNLIFTGGVAPSQKLPDLPDTNKDIQAFRDRVMKNRAAYLGSYKNMEDIKYRNKALEGRAEDRLLRARALDNQANSNANTQARIAETERHNKEMERLRGLDIDNDAFEAETERAQKESLISQKDKELLLRERGIALQEAKAGGKTVTTNYDRDADGHIIESTRTESYNGQPSTRSSSPSDAVKKPNPMQNTKKKNPMN